MTECECGREYFATHTHTQRSISLQFTYFMCVRARRDYFHRRRAIEDVSVAEGPATNGSFLPSKRSCSNILNKNVPKHQRPGCNSPNKRSRAPTLRVGTRLLSSCCLKRARLPPLIPNVNSKRIGRLVFWVKHHNFTKPFPSLPSSVSLLMTAALTVLVVPLDCLCLSQKVSHTSSPSGRRHQPA